MMDLFEKWLWIWIALGFLLSVLLFAAFYAYDAAVRIKDNRSIHIRWDYVWETSRDFILIPVSAFAMVFAGVFCWPYFMWLTVLDELRIRGLIK